MARKKGGRRYSEKQKLEVISRVQSGETQKAIAGETGIPLATVGYWARKAKNGTGPKAGRKRGRPRSAISSPKAGRNQGIVWKLEGDVLVVRIPLRSFARQIAQKALAEV
jgi:transposase-like protein